MSKMVDAAQAGAQRPEEKEEKKRRGFFWWWLMAIFAALLLVLLLSGLAFLIMSWLWAPVKEEVAKTRVENAVIFPVDGVDSQGRSAAFDFIVLTEEFTWVKGSTFQVESRGQVVTDAAVVEKVISPDIRRSLLGSQELIAVGLASQEGDRAIEEQRAARRSRTVLGWMVLVAPPEKPLWRLNLGQYNGELCKAQEDADTSFQRPLILIGVRERQDGADLSEALTDAITGKANLPSRECYSRFDLVEAR
jgi:hypothetical protein